MSYQALLFCQDEKTARTVTQVLSELEFQVEACTETFAAVKKLTNQAFEAVVVDCQNEESASLLLKAARNSVSNQASLMVALVEGQTGVAAAFRIGANLVLTKPIAVEQARGTLRVARGLLRKNVTTSAPVAAKPAAAAPVAPPLPALPSVVKPEPTRAPAAAVPAPTRAISPAPPATPRVGPVQPSAFRAIAASANLESESERQELPDAASAGLLEALEFKTFEPAPQPPFAHAASEIVSVAELNTGAHEAVRAALAPRAPMSSQDFAAGFGAAAVAPARELPPLATPAMSAEVSELFEAPVFGQTTGTATEPAESSEAYNPEVDFSGSPAPSGSKTPLLAVAAILVLVTVFYFGWAQFHKPVTTNSPTSGPLQPPPPDFGAADTANQAPPPAASHPAPAPIAQDSNQGETINRFSRGSKVAEDRVTTPIAVVSHSASPASQTPMQVKSELQRPTPSTLGQESAEAPSIANLGAPKPDALNTIIRSTAAVIPTAPSQRVSQGVVEGKVLKAVQPLYPLQAVQMHVQGTVTLQATVAKDGSVSNVKVISGPASLARAASDAVRQWKYRPFLLNGDPVEAQTTVKINFTPPR